MRKLDRNRPFGTVNPPYQPEGCDRAGLYEQDGALFDAYDREIVPGKPYQPEREKPALSGPPQSGAIADLLAKADAMKWPELRKAAKAIIGKTPKTDRAGLMALLQAAAGKTQEDDPSPPKPDEPFKGMTWDRVAAVEPKPAKTNGHSNSVDLAAWGRGECEYLFSEIARALRASEGREAATRAEAVAALVDAGVIRSAEARQDV